MRFAPLMAGVALAALMTQPGLAASQDTKQPQAMPAGQTQQVAQADVDFAKKAAGDGMAEVKLGELAKQQGKSDPVQQFGERMVKDHGEANDKLKAIAETKGIDLPQSPSDEAQKAYDDLKQKNGQEFDQAYMDAMVEDHHKAIELFQKEADSGKDADLQGFAEATLPTLKEHLDLAQKTQEQVTASDATGNDKMAATGAAVTAPMPDQQAAGQPMQTEDSGATPPADQQAMKDNGAVTPPPPNEPAGGQPMPDATVAATGAGQQPTAKEPMPSTDQQAAVTPDQKPAAGTGGAPVMAKEVIGTNVVNTKGDDVGEIKDLVIDQSRVAYAVVSVGGFLGIGDKDVAIPLDQLKLGKDQSYLMTAETEAQLKQMPEYKKEQFEPKS